MNGYLLIDGNSIAHAANAGTVLKIGSKQVQAVFGMLRTMRKLMSLYAGYQPIILWDGASWRKMIFKEYKENRERENTLAERQQKAAKEELNKQKPIIDKALCLLGLPQLKAMNMEADDLAALLVNKYHKTGLPITLVSGDQDWIQLVRERVVWFDPIRNRKVNHRNFEEFTGVKTPRQFVELKAIMGDSGDNIDGVGGIGDKGAVEFLRQFESFNNFSNMALDKSLDVSKLPKKFRLFAEDEGKRMRFIKNMELVDLNTTVRPKPINLHLNQGEPSVSRFEQLCKIMMFKSILQDLHEWLSVFPAYIDGRMQENENEKIAS